MAKRAHITVGILGGRGMLGSDLASSLSRDYEVTPIDKDDYDSHAGKSFDVVINANGNSRRFWANGHPFQDFEASTVSVYRSMFDFRYSLYIYISSSDVYEDHSNPATTREKDAEQGHARSPYGLHKYLSERIVRFHVPRYLILRSSLIIGSRLKKGPVYDILHGNELFITPESKLQMITAEAIAGVIDTLLQNGMVNEIFNMGGTGTFSFADAEHVFGIAPRISKEAEVQRYEMNVEKLLTVYPLKSSEEYLSWALQNNVR